MTGKNSLLGVFDICGVKKLTVFRLEFSALNEHRFIHNFQCISPMCACNTGIEDNAEFFCIALCLILRVMIKIFLGQLPYLPELHLSNIDPQAILYIFLYGSPIFNENENRRILEASIA